MGMRSLITYIFYVQRYMFVIYLRGLMTTIKETKPFIYSLTLGVLTIKIYCAYQRKTFLQQMFSKMDDKKYKTEPKNSFVQ